MGEPEMSILRESFDLLVLKSLSWGPRHGYAILEWIEQATDAVLFVSEGTLYPALHRLARRGLVETEWGLSEQNRRAKFYRLTAEGRARLRARGPAWQHYVGAIGRALAAPGPEAA